MPSKRKKQFHKKIPSYAIQNGKIQTPVFVVDASPNTKSNFLESIPSPIKDLVTPTNSNLLFFKSPNTGKSRCLDSAENATGTYRHIISTGSKRKAIDIFMVDSPAIDKENDVPKTIKIAPSNRESLMEFCDYYPEIMKKPSSFSFTITRNDLVFKKRRYNQKNITHYTARDFLKIFAEKLPLNKKYHLAHRRGHHLGGDGSVENLDAGTAGSNFTTLCYIETVIDKLLIKGNAQVITVNGEVTYDAEYRCIVRHIDYYIYADNIKIYTKRIEHLEHRKPRIEEHDLAFGLAEFMISSALSEYEEDAEKDIAEGNQQQNLG